MIQPSPNIQYVPVVTAQPQPFRPIPIPEDKFTPLGFMAATLTIASAAGIGANMVEVKNKTMTPAGAVLNGIAKGAAASIILSLTPKQTVFDIAVTAAALAGTSYAIDRAVKKSGSSLSRASED